MTHYQMLRLSRAYAEYRDAEEAAGREPKSIEDWKGNR